MKKLLLLMLCLGIGPPALLAQLPASPFSGTITASGCITVPTGNKGTVTFQVSGSWSGTIQPEGKIDGNTPFDVQVNPFQSATPQSTITANGIYTLNVPGLDALLLCGATVTSTATVKGNAVQIVAKSTSGGGASGVSSFTGDGTIISNSGSTGAVTVTLANTPTGTGGVVLKTSPTLLGTPDASGAAQFKLPVAAGYTALADGEIGWDSTFDWPHAWGMAGNVGGALDKALLLQSVTEVDANTYAKGSATCGIQEAINALPNAAAVGGLVHIHGRCTTSTQLTIKASAGLPDSITLQGDSPNGSQISFGGAGTTGILKIGGTTFDTRHVAVKDLNFSCNGGLGCIGINAIRTKNLVIEHNLFDNSGAVASGNTSACVVLDGSATAAAFSSFSHVVNNRCVDGWHYWVRQIGSGSNEASNNNNLYENNEATQLNAPDGIAYDLTTGGSTQVIGGDISGYTTAYHVGGRGGKFDSSALEGNNTTQFNFDNSLFTAAQDNMMIGFCTPTCSITDTGSNNRRIDPSTATGTGGMVLQTSPGLLGIPTTPTAALNTSTTQIASTAFVMGQAGAAGAPGWLKYFGDGSDGTGPASGALAGDVSMYTTWTCTGTITARGTNRPTIILATGAVNLNAGCVINAAPVASTQLGDIGGTGGGGGGGTGAGTAGSITNLWVPLQATRFTVAAGGTAGASSGGAGGAGVTPTFTGDLNWRKAFFISPPAPLSLLLGGTAGGIGGTGSSVAGLGAGLVIIVAPSITIASGVNITAAGGTGAPATANNNGGAGGGGGGVILLAAQTITDNGMVLNTQGGPGGGCINPAIVLGTTGLTGIPATSGTGALAHVSTFAAGNPTVVTVDAAGSGYDYTPSCSVVGSGGGANTGSGATCAVTMAGSSPNKTVASIAVSGGNAGYGTGTTFTTCGVGGYGGNGWSKTFLVQ